MSAKPEKAAEISRQYPVWECTIPDEQWQVYQEAIQATRGKGVQFLLGGAFGLAAYTGRCRNTKDLDFFVLAREKDQAVKALTEAGFEDYFSTLEYDRGWIYRGTRDGVIVDVIWQTPNRRTEVDEQWFERSREIRLRGENLRVIPAEELLAIKVYVMQRDRCDWPDLINLLYAHGASMDWEHVFSRMNGETPLMAGLLQVYNWVAPERARSLPGWVREKLHLSNAGTGDSESMERQRVELLDSRPWFAAFQPMDKPMQL